MGGSADRAAVLVVLDPTRCVWHRSPGGVCCDRQSWAWRGAVVGAAGTEQGVGACSSWGRLGPACWPAEGCAGLGMQQQTCGGWRLSAVLGCRAAAFAGAGCDAAACERGRVRLLLRGGLCAFFLCMAVVHAPQRLCWVASLCALAPPLLLPVLRRRALAWQRRVPATRHALRAERPIAFDCCDVLGQCKHDGCAAGAWLLACPACAPQRAP
jgi:hypothetical protein